jgi:hypothetical protein
MTPITKLIDKEIIEALHKPGCERVMEFYIVGPVQKAAIMSFADSIETVINARWKKLLAELTPSDHELLQKALDALFYHTQQTRPIHSTNLIMEEISERLK